MTLKQLEAFVKIANNKSFTTAARDLYITQPTVSAYINNLEEELGVRIFDRTTKDVKLSKEGSKIYLYAKEIIELTEKIQTSFLPEEEKTQSVKNLIISTSSLPGQFLLPEILANFGKKYPGVLFNVKETDSEGVMEDIVEHRADIGFAGTITNSSKCSFIPFFEDEIVVIAPNFEKYIALQGEKDLSWVEKENFIMRESGSGTRKEAIRLLENIGITTDKLQIKATFEKTTSVVNSVQEGLGIALVSRIAVKKELESGKLIEFKISNHGGFRKIYLVMEKKTKLSWGARNMINVINKLYSNK